MGEAHRLRDPGSGVLTPLIDPTTAITLVPPLPATSLSPPMIETLPDDGPRPFWSVMIPIYNCPANYLRETLESVLCQDPGTGEMQIEVVDNCSTMGDPEALVREIGRGRVQFHRQPSNLGIVENFNTCIRRARGHWVHILHGDDTVRPGFYAHARQGITANPGVGAALCRTVYTDEDGQWLGLTDVEARQPAVLGSDFVDRQLVDQLIQFVSIVVRRTTYEELGGFRSSLAHCLDWDMWKRIAIRKPIFYDPELLACYRLHEAADSSRLMRTGENVADERRSIEISCADMPPERARAVRRAARKAAAVRAVRRARRLWQKGDHATAWRQLTEAFRCSLAPAVLARTAYFFVRVVLR
ncbi:glycosyltransferase [Vineibacter terrae]|uniref:glycosyltransferase n=1 Tax=Vineibacter terrae TaxID=2586908 RepID=UPI002E2FB656|nr:glycosyltransferase [Vineibacter terrae]HEX2889122.1 glycosyltransferase [Vineibacter terrae]